MVTTSLTSISRPMCSARRLICAVGWSGEGDLKTILSAGHDRALLPPADCCHVVRMHCSHVQQQQQYQQQHASWHAQ